MMTKKLIACFILVCTLFTCIFTLGSCGSNDPETVAKKATTAYLNVDFRKFESYFWRSTEDSVEFFAHDSDMTLQEFLEEVYECRSISEFIENEEKNYKDRFDNIYGDFKYEIRKVTIEDYTNREYKEFIDEIKNDDSDKDFYQWLDFDTDDISDVCKAIVKVRIEGEKDKRTSEFEFTLINYKGKWLIFEHDLSQVLFYEYYE